MTRPAFLSQQVDRTSYYYLNLTASHSGALAVVCGGREHCRPEYTIDRPTFHYRCIEFVAEGCGELRMAGRTVALGPGTVFRYGPGIPHRIRTDAAHPMTKYFIDFTGKGADKLMATSSLGEGVVQVRDPGRVRELFDTIQQVAGDGSPHAGTVAVLLLQALVLVIDSLSRQPVDARSRAAASYDRCRQVMDEHYRALPGLSDVAKTCRMDPATICRLFKRFGGGSPYQYLLRRKMNHAAARLQATGILVKEVAAEVGFSDPYHFSRAFKRIHGLSPQRFVAQTARNPLQGSGKIVAISPPRRS